MQSKSHSEQAERLSRRRARMMPMLAVFVLIQQVIFFTEDGLSDVSTVKTVAWLVLAAVIVAALATGGFWLKPRAVRALMDDEVTRANRASALTLGFVVAMAMGIVLFALETFAPGSASTREVIHLIVTYGLVAAMIRFGLLERRALG